MAEARAFRAVRPQPGIASLVAAPPYDVLNSAEAKELAQGNPNSFLHVDKAEIDLPSCDQHDPAVYQKADENLKAMISSNILVQDPNPCYYIYRLTMDGRAQTGLGALASAEEYLEGSIKKHEMTRPDKLEDRIRHMEAIKAQTGLIFLAYKNQGSALPELLDNWAQSHEPVYDFTASYASTPADSIYLKTGIRHQVWVVDDDSAISSIAEEFKKIPAVYIADGHHRVASAAQVYKNSKSEEAKGILSIIFPHDQLYIMDYNRVVRDLNGLSEKEFLDALSKSFSVSSSEKVKPTQKGTFYMYLNGNRYLLQAKDPAPSDPVGSLDVSILSERVLNPILGIGDPRTDKRIDFIGGMRGLEELERKVDSGRWAAAFGLCPPTMDELIAIADSGNLMPPKSTWFEPKLRGGLLVHLLG
ncbi:MAG: DUF1015 family protein [Clostridiales bacterium]|jgi:uncharacterized protein (DUF1015 family)|nr:DUF1015 family protein [Clostridiales bacterium]